MAGVPADLFHDTPHPASDDLFHDAPSEETRSLAEQESDRELSGQRDITPTSKLGKLAMQASHGYLGNALPWLEGLAAKVLPNPAGLTREDYANALNKSRADTGITGMVAEGGGTLANPFLRSLGPATGGAVMGAGESASQGGDLGDVVKSAGLNAALGKGGSILLGGIANRFPELADRLAERITSQPMKEGAKRLSATIRGNYEPGQYARDVIDYGLNKLTSRGTAEAAQNLAREAGPALGEARGMATVAPSTVKEIVQEGIDMAPEGSKALGELKLFARQLDKTGAPLDLTELADHTMNYIKDPLRSAGQGLALGNTSPSEVRALSHVNETLEALQKSKIDPDALPVYDELRKQYAISQAVLKPSVQAATKPLSAHGLIRRGALGVAGHLAGSAVGLPGLGTLVGVAAGGRPGAYAALKAYQASRTAPAQMLAKAAKAAAPGIQQAVARATASGQPEQAGAAIQKAQANDPNAR